MCGIAGVVYRERERPVSQPMIRAMCASLRHRGPDEEGVFVQANVGLGMRRLSIIDVAGSQQPIFSEDRSKVFVFNGEIYNYRELRRRLRRNGHHLASRGDTETVVHLYEEEGPECVRQLRGMFAFALWDATAGQLLLARDRFGMKPLYVVTASWGIAFASELKALHTVGLTGGELDWHALDSYFHLGYIPAPATPFAAVRKLEPGHTLVWSQDGSVAVRKYWDLPVGAEPAGAGDTAERVRTWLDESVSAHLESDVPLAVFLSGGLDSSAVASSMALSGYGAHAYTARYRGSGAASHDESGLATLLANRYGARLTVVDIEPDLRDLIEPIVYALDEPHADESAVPTWLLSRAVSADYKVALAGTGGDELFGGYRRHIGILLSELHRRVPRGARNAAGAVAQLLREPAGSNLSINRLKRFLRNGGGDFADRYFRLQDRFPGERTAFYALDRARSLGASDPAAEQFARHWQSAGSPRGLEGALYLDYKTYLPDDLLHLGDRLSMAHSLEMRMPFVDHEFVEQAFPIPARTKLGPLQNKRLLRRALAPRLPREHMTAVKRGFVGPTASWLRNELREMLVEELSQERMSRLGFFAPGGIDGLLNDHFSLRHNREGILWALLCFSIWHRQYVETPMPAWDAPAVRLAASS